jgi:hypothetical protein
LSRGPTFKARNDSRIAGLERNKKLDEFPAGSRPGGSVRIADVRGGE